VPRRKIENSLRRLQLPVFDTKHPTCVLSANV
jgi:hypothetical protein